METRRMCPHCRAFITTNDRVCPYCNERVGPRAIDRRNPSPILGFIPHAQFVTSIILLVNIALYIATMLNANVLAAGDKSRFDIHQGEWWRLVTAGFLHGNLLHILLNSWVLFDVGAQVEQVYGASRMLVIYLVSSVAGFYLSYLWTPNPSVGASAGIMGLIGAMIALSVHHRSALTTAIRGQYIRWVIYMLLIGLIIPGIDNAAHVGGLAAGFGVAYFAGLPRLEGSPQEQGWRIASYVCIALTAFSFFNMYQWFMHGGAQL
jgi:rhomboid protease GluP